MENLPQKEPNDSEPEIKKYRNKKKKDILACHAFPNLTEDTAQNLSIHLNFQFIF